MAIKSFRNTETEKIWNEQFVKKFSRIAVQALNRLEQLDAAESIDDLRAVRGNRFEALKGDRAGQFSIRVNDQYRICFRWEVSNAYEVEITDYH